MFKTHFEMVVIVKMVGAYQILSSSPVMDLEF